MPRLNPRTQLLGGDGAAIARDVRIRARVGAYVQQNREVLLAPAPDLPLLGATPDRPALLHCMLPTCHLPHWLKG